MADTANPAAGEAFTAALWIRASESAGKETACRLAAELDGRIVPRDTQAAALPAGGVLLEVEETLSLRQTGPGAPGPVTVDFGDSRMRHRRQGGQNELLGRAIGLTGGLKKPVLDATAGLGRDAFVLADLGCRVWLCERQPVIACLLQSGLERAASGDAWLAGTASRMTLLARDARSLRPHELPPVQVIYLDPMFARDKSRAKPKKEMALFQTLFGADTQGQQRDAAHLLDWACSRPVERVVVKRPLKAPPLDRRQPSHELRGRAVRFDVYMLAPRAVVSARE